VYSEIVADSYTYKSAHALINNIKSYVTAKGSTDTSGDFDLDHMTTVDALSNIIQSAFPNTLTNSTISIGATANLWEPSITYRLRNSLSVDVTPGILINNTIVQDIKLSPEINVDKHYTIYSSQFDVRGTSSVASVPGWYICGGDYLASSKVSAESNTAQQAISTEINNSIDNIEGNAVILKITGANISGIYNTVDANSIMYRNSEAVLEHTVEISATSTGDNYGVININQNVTYVADANKIYDGAANVLCDYIDVDANGYTEISIEANITSSCKVISAAWHSGDGLFSIDNYCQIDANCRIIIQGEISANLSGVAIVTNPYLDAFWIPRGIRERLIYVSSNSVAFNVAGAQVYTHETGINNNQLIAFFLN